MKDYRRFFVENAACWKVEAINAHTVLSSPSRSGWSGFGESRTLENGIVLGRSHIRYAYPAVEPSMSFSSFPGLYFIVEANYSVYSSRMNNPIHCQGGQIWRRGGDLGHVGAAWHGSGETRVLSLDFHEELLARWGEDFLLPKWLCKGSSGAPFEACHHLCRQGSWMPQAAQIIARPIKTLTDLLTLESMTLALCADLFDLTPIAKASSRIDDALDIILSEYREPLTIVTLARRCGINECYFKQQFKAVTGTSVATYIRALRMREAMRLLLDEGKSVKETAWYVGYRDSGHFSKVFKKMYGILPSQVLRK